MPYQYGNEDPPLTRGERWMLAIFFVLLVGMLAAETFSNYRPAKLSILFFILTWFPLLALHELGHALAARLCGWRVAMISLGMGRIVRSFHIGDTYIEIRVIPIEGFVIPQPRSLHKVRRKSAFIYFAGVGMELLLLLLLTLIIGPSALLSQTTSIPIILAQTFCVAITMSVLVNLAPHSSIRRHRHHQDILVSDGLGIIRSFTQPIGAFEDRIVGTE